MTERFANAFGAHESGRGSAHSMQGVYRWLVAVVFLVYVLGAIGMYLWRGVTFRPDTWVLVLLVGALVLGRIQTFLIDWIPFVFLVFGYELLRGIAGEIVTGGGLVGNRERSELPAVQVESLLRLDRALFAGHEPVSTLQSWLYTPDDPRWWDYLALVVYSLHFVLPCMFAFLLWLTARERFWHFTLALCLMTYTAFFAFLLFPAAPPWLANSWGVVHDIQWPAGSVVETIRIAPIRELDTLSIWKHASPDPVAAMPSLHAAFPWLVLLTGVRVFGWRGLWALPYNVVLWFSVVYLANHWVIDVLAGIAWATVAFLMMEGVWAVARERFGDRLSPTRSHAPPVTTLMQHG